jgi:Tfp pilus assembly protein FimT
MPRDRRGSAGWSILETVVSAAIVTVLMAIAFPNFRTMSAPYVQRQTTQQIAAEFQRMRMRAIASNSRYKFAYDATNRVYSIQRETAPGSGNFTTEYRNQLPVGVTLGTISNGNPIFDTRGSLNANTNIPVSVTGGTHVRTVTINVLGQVSFS